jgi:hypothetical protein
VNLGDWASVAVFRKSLDATDHGVGTASKKMIFVSVVPGAFALG